MDSSNKNCLIPTYNILFSSYQGIISSFIKIIFLKESSTLFNKLLSYDKYEAWNEYSTYGGLPMLLTKKLTLKK